MCICSDFPAISLDNLTSGSTADQACGSFENCIDFFTNHKSNFPEGVVVKKYEFDRPKCDYFVGFHGQ